MDETSGEFISSKVKGLMDMGIQQTYLLITDKGKTIRTTANHPYFIKETKKASIMGGVYQVDQSPRIETLTQDSFIAIANSNIRLVVKIDKQTKRKLHEMYQALGEGKFFAPDLLVFGIRVLLNFANIHPTRVQIDNEYPGYENRIRQFIKASNPDVDIEVKSIGHGKKAYAHWASYLSYKGKEEVDFEFTNKKDRGILQRRGQGTVTLVPLNQIRSTRGLIRQDYHKLEDLSTHSINSGLILSLPNVSNAKWRKVYDIKPGMEVATVDGWEKVVALKEYSREQVFDIEVENTHNFVGNDIVAHNTYITGNVGLGIASPATNLHLLGSGTGTGVQLLTQNNTQTNFGLAVLDNGNVGIGTTGPDYQLVATKGGNTFKWIDAGPYIRVDDGTRQIGMGTDSTNKGWIGSISNDGLGFRTNNAVKMWISTDGNVGIGTNTPGSALSVIGNVGIGTSAAGAALQVNGGGLFGWGTASSALSSGAILGVNGNVGVGTTSPLANLHVVGQCVAEGTLIKRRRRRRKTMDDGEIEDGDLKIEDRKVDKNNLSSTLNPIKQEIGNGMK
ncbi:hypothetical protein HYW41_01005 [Candidatus Daviesbacteria bacterium]|nr:hypothetical protein [Candidatus Daviesbacteria bacterium]